MVETVLALVIVMFATFTLGYLFGFSNRYKNNHLRIFSLVYTAFYCTQLASLLAHFAESGGLHSAVVILKSIDIVFEILLYILIFYFINYFYGIIKTKNIAVLIILYFFPFFTDFIESGSLGVVYPKFFLFLDNISSVPLLVYILIIGIGSYRKFNNNDLKHLFRTTLIILFSVNFIFLLDGFLETVFRINIPKDPVIVIVFSLLSYIYLHYFIIYISKENTGPAAEFVESYNISKREQEIIYLLLKGNSYKDISEKLFISFATVKTHIHNIYVKTNVSSRFALMDLIQRK